MLRELPREHAGIAGALTDTLPRETRWWKLSLAKLREIAAAGADGLMAERIPRAAQRSTFASPRNA